MCISPIYEACYPPANLCNELIWGCRQALDEYFGLLLLDCLVALRDTRVKTAIQKPSVFLEPGMLDRDIEDRELPSDELLIHPRHRSVGVDRRPSIEEVQSRFEAVQYEYLPPVHAEEH